MSRNNLLWLCLSLLLINPVVTYSASTDAARVAGDLKVDGIHFSSDGSVITKLSDAIGPQGIPGSNGSNSLILLTDEILGANCTSGGVKIQVGLDQNRNSILEAGEVAQTKFVCNGGGNTNR